MTSDAIQLPRPTWETGEPPVPEDTTLVLVAARLSDWEPIDDELAARHLSPDEQKRAAEFRFLDDVRRHLLGRLIFRTVVGRWCNSAPADLRVAPGPCEKPRLCDHAFTFNVSHGGDHVVAAFGRETDLGIDVEPRERQPGEEGLAESVLTSREFERWQDCPPERRARLFMHLWTAKESLIKATGEGLYRDPTTIDCQFQGRQVTGFRRLGPTDTDIDVGDPGDWRPRPFDIGDDGVACVTWRGGERELQFVQYAPDVLGNPG